MHTFMETPVAMRTLEWGRAGGPRALLVHGVQSAANTWWRIASGLAAAGLHVTAPDLRGHGASPSAEHYRLADFTRDLAELGGGWDLAVGHSLGATVLAHALAADPDTARRAVLLEPVLELPEDGFEAIVAGQLAELEDPSAAAIQAENPGWHPDDCRLKALAAAACSPHVNEAVLRENRPWDHAHLVTELRTPALILGGVPARGAMVDPSLGRSLAAANRWVGYGLLDGAGHSPHRDRPAEVVAALLEG